MTEQQTVTLSPVEIPPNTLVLVTNATQLLDRVFAEPIKAGRFERVSLSPGHPLHKSVYRDAVKGVHAIVHSPAVPNLDNTLEDVWSLTAASVTCMLEAAEREATVQAVVYTSSMVAAAPLVTPRDVAVTDDSWNIKDTMRAVTSPRGGDHVVRNSALVRAEQELWEWYEEQRPEFKINVVSPSNIIGQVLGAEHTTDWRNWLWRLYRYGRAGEVIPGAGPTQAHWYVDVEDVALLHVAAMFDPDIASCRLQAWGCFRDVNDAMAVLERLDGTKVYRRVGDDGVNRGQLYTSFTRVSEILRRWKGKGSWKEFEDTVVESIGKFATTDGGTPPSTSPIRSRPASCPSHDGEDHPRGRASRPRARYLDISHRPEDLEDGENALEASRNMSRSSLLP
ncbi:hypothetical protein VTJ83DRAFT_6008 [Remersonia thermophila]|uniref:3-beta hydroxysteroid dehydrogenase/isomerase domain-containing protein n=1 Tax=Remersonia thermophila TaxID=72144 RepID=A0ABR4D8L2_9PEZI